MAPFAKKLPGRRKVAQTNATKDECAVQKSTSCSSSKEAPVTSCSGQEPTCCNKAPATSSSAPDLRPRCCCGKRSDHEKAAGRYGRTTRTWHCSSCSSSHGSSMLQARAEDIDARSRAVDDKLAKATALLRNAMQLESQFADRVTNPERMGKTGEPLCVLLPAHNKMVCPCFALCIPALGFFVFCTLVQFIIY
jgi:hypothetical protein